MITSVEILKIVKNTEVTPKMERAIRTQYKAFFLKAEAYVIDYDLYYKVKAYKSFNPLEKAKIAYETLSRLYAGIVFNLGFLDHWEDELREYLKNLQDSEKDFEQKENTQMQVVGFISYGDLNIRVLKKADFFNDDILAELGA